MIKVGIIGATGYAGGEIVRILTGHPDAKICWYGSRSYADRPFGEIFQNFFRIVDEKCVDEELASLAEQVDVIFTATPQGYLASVLTEEILSGTKVIDLSADFRIKDVAVYEQWYGIEHKSPQLIRPAGADPDRGQGGESRLLSHLYLFVCLSPYKRGLHRSGYADCGRQIRHLRRGAWSQGPESVL